MQLSVFGLSHRTAPLELRERVAFLEGDAQSALGELVEREPFTEAALLSTCNRTELYVATATPDDAERLWWEFACDRRQVDVAGHTYRYEHRDCVQHLCRVAAGADSMVLGETGILGQVRHAQEWAARAETLGPLLGKLFPAALRSGKRARTETAIGQGAGSHARAGVALAAKIFGKLGHRRGLIIGAGETGAHTASHLSEAGMTSLRFANRTRNRAEELATRYGGEVVDFEALEEAIAAADVVVTAVASPERVLTARTIRAALERRGRERPLLIVDLGVPRNVEPEVGSFRSLFLYSVDDLESLIALNLERRRKELPKVEAIVDEEASRYVEWFTSLGATPTVVALRDHAERLRQESLTKYRKGASPEELERMEQFSRALLNRMLHDPLRSIRSCDPQTREGIDHLDWTRRLFGLGAPDGPEDETE